MEKSEVRTSTYLNLGTRFLICYYLGTSTKFSIIILKISIDDVLLVKVFTYLVVVGRGTYSVVNTGMGLVEYLDRHPLSSNLR
eukprot:SAG31_NODE_3068_length_4720_cov_9.192258_1_plen_82_part_10